MWKYKKIFATQNFRENKREIAFYQILNYPKSKLSDSKILKFPHCVQVTDIVQISFLAYYPIDC